MTRIPLLYFIRFVVFFLLILLYRYLRNRKGLYICNAVEIVFKEVTKKFYAVFTRRTPIVPAQKTALESFASQTIRPPPPITPPPVHITHTVRPRPTQIHFSCIVCALETIGFFFTGYIQSLFQFFFCPLDVFYFYLLSLLSLLFYFSPPRTILFLIRSRVKSSDKL